MKQFHKHTALVLIIAASSATVWTGCGNDSGNSNGRVSILATPEMVVDVDVDPDTVNETSVQLLASDESPVKGTVEFEADNRIVRFHPDRPLDYGETYRFRVAGVSDRQGSTIAAAEEQFTTFFNPLVRTLRYDEGSDEISRYEEFEFAMDRRLSASTYNAPGADEVWFSSDDILSLHIDFEYDGNGRRTREIQYTGPEPDAFWRPGDDTRSHYIEFGYNDDGKWISEARFTGPGPDEVWFSSDDTQSRHVEFGYDDDGNWISEARYTGPGADEVWRTPDDELDFYQGRIRDDSGRLWRIFVGAEPGPDGDWFTSDDVLTRYTEYRYDADGRFTRSIVFQDPGADQTWFTEDDGPASYHDRPLDGDLTTIDYNEPGPDGVWFTGDDVPHRYTREQDDPNQRTEFYEVGPDQTIGTEDDWFYRSEETQLNDVGLVSRYSASWGSNPVDGIDRRSHVEFSYDEKGNRTQSEAEWNEPPLLIVAEYDTSQ